MDLRRLLRVLSGALLPLATLAILFFGSELSSWAEQVGGPDAGVPNFPDASIFEWQQVVLVLVAVSIAASIGGSICLVLLRRSFPHFDTWLRREPPWRRLLYRVLFTIAVWVGASATVAWHDGIAPPAWLHYDVYDIVEFGLLQLLLAVGAWTPYTPGAVMTLLSRHEVDQVVTHMRGEMTPSDADTHPATDL